jgi:NDP-sugar pyrophosphorylase family protein
MRKRTLVGGIIAAGAGSRLRRDGFAVPKPLVPVAGVPLIARVIRNFIAARITSVRIIVNGDNRQCVNWVRSHFPKLDADFVVKSTASSLESFAEITGATTRHPARDPMLVSTVDACCAERDFAHFAEAATARAPEATVLAVTPLVADENPLWVDVGDDGRITSLGGERGRFVTAGFYFVSGRVRQSGPPGGLRRLREYLTWLWRSGEPMYGEVIERVVDVDRRQDVALAEALTFNEQGAERR